MKNKISIIIFILIILIISIAKQVLVYDMPIAANVAL